MKIYIDKTESTWVDISTKDSHLKLDLTCGGYNTYYRVSYTNTVVEGVIRHMMELTDRQKIELIKNELNITN